LAGGVFDVTVARAGRGSRRPVHFEVIGSTTRARTWLARAEWFAAEHALVVLVAPPASLLLRAHVERARQLAESGSVVYVIAGPPQGSFIRPWYTVEWVAGPHGMLRLRVRAPGGHTGRAGDLPGHFRSAWTGEEPRAAAAVSRGQPVAAKAQPRRAVALRLAGKGPAAAAYAEQYGATHATGPTWADIAGDLTWPGDAIDHARALEALVRAGWVTASEGPALIRPGRRWIERAQATTVLPPILRMAPMKLPGGTFGP
jgi:hypothetical protein